MLQILFWLIIFPSSLIPYIQDPDASYDVNDGDPDPQPRYTQLNDNRYVYNKSCKPATISWSIAPCQAGDL